ncbi:hypothetical protein J3D54_000229 [Pseudomonas sp. GGS8]|uniref:hypothetical protein n=1 Tax=Pseudomonas sp. GGS8 TaxID=2817892 RepID=UPI0020A17BBF|nr:hypothetical protein [Pseudomonas sp. GGS8]MCP1441097.1 hypothetical protein [Pseudomonas sp. GGS8]
MLFWEWERLESFIEQNHFQISDAGKLITPISSFKLRRDPELQLYLETKSQKMATSEQESHPPGTVHINEETVSFLSINGCTGLASGVQILSTNSNNNIHHNTRQTTQTSSVHQFECHTTQTGPVEFTFDWIANMDDCFYIWPDGVRDKLITTPTRTFGSDVNKITFEAESITEGNGRKCVDMTICGQRVILGVTKAEDIDQELKPGYILFPGEPDDATRKKIRDGLSFILGFPIIHIGSSKLDEQQQLKSFKAISANSMDGRAFKTQVLPPAPVTIQNTTNMIDKTKLERMVNSFCDNYESYGLSSLNWNYWYAMTAPTHMAPAYFGAIIESIQKKHIETLGSKFNNCIISKKEYKEIKLIILKATQETKLSPQDKKVLIEKLSNGNSASQKIRSQRFFEYLGLDMGTAELSAWQRRNDAAHGNDIPNKDYISLIKETKLLKLILHRIVLKITNASDSYIDYYSLHFPTRQISSGVSDEASATSRPIGP